MIFKQLLLLLYHNPLNEDKQQWSYEILSIILQTLRPTSVLKCCIPSELPNSLLGLPLCSLNQLKMVISYNELNYASIIGNVSKVIKLLIVVEKWKNINSTFQSWWTWFETHFIKLQMYFRLYFAFAYVSFMRKTTEIWLWTHVLFLSMEIFSKRGNIYMWIF